MRKPQQPPAAVKHQQTRTLREAALKTPAGTVYRMPGAPVAPAPQR